MSSTHRPYPLQSWRAAKDAAVDAAEVRLADAVRQLHIADDGVRAARDAVARLEFAWAQCEAHVRELARGGCSASAYASALDDEALARRRVAEARVELEHRLAQQEQRQQQLDLAHDALADEQASLKAVEQHAEQWMHAQARVKDAAAQEELDEYATTVLAAAGRAKTE
jgi:hypothetical protein